MNELELLKAIKARILTPEQLREHLDQDYTETRMNRYVLPWLICMTANQIRGDTGFVRSMEAAHCNLSDRVHKALEYEGNRELSTIDWLLAVRAGYSPSGAGGTLDASEAFVRDKDNMIAAQVYRHQLLAQWIAELQPQQESQ